MAACHQADSLLCLWIVAQPKGVCPRSSAVNHVLGIHLVLFFGQQVSKNHSNYLPLWVLGKIDEFSPVENIGWLEGIWHLDAVAEAGSEQGGKEQSGIVEGSVFVDDSGVEAGIEVGEDIGEFFSAEEVGHAKGGGSDWRV